MNKKYYIKNKMSANLFEGNKSNKKNYKENPLLEMINRSEDDKESNIYIQEDHNTIFNNSKIMNINNELKDKISEI